MLTTTGGRGEALGGTSTFSTLLPSLRLGPGKEDSQPESRAVTTWKDSHLEPSCLWARRSPRTSSARTALGASTQAPTQGVLRNSRPCIGSPRSRSPPAALCEGAGAALAGRCRQPQPSVSSSLRHCKLGYLCILCVCLTQSMFATPGH